MGKMSVDYDEYLGLEKGLGAQHLRSVEFSRPAHDKMLFVIVHQTYELWFKQILHERDSVLGIFQADHARLERIVTIQNLLIDLVTVLETMAPLDFLEFRDLLYPASGFQSTQFRLIENRLGLLGPYRQALPAHSQEATARSEQEPRLFDRVQSWLERTPFLKTGTYDFWAAYERAVVAGFARDEAMARSAGRTSPTKPPCLSSYFVTSPPCTCHFAC